MNIKNIKYPSPLSEIDDIENDNIDVFVEIDDGMTYTFVVATPKNYYWYMDKEGLDYIPASPPDIIVRSLTEENIRKAIESYLEDEGYWLKLYFLAGKREGTFEVEAMDMMIEEIKETNKKVFGG
jgi:hypothetical protein